MPFTFTGTLHQVVIRLGEGPRTAEDEEQMRRAKAAITLSQSKIVTTTGSSV